MSEEDKAVTEDKVNQEEIETLALQVFLRIFYK